jgi:flagellar motor protein MotB
MTSRVKRRPDGDMIWAPLADIMTLVSCVFLIVFIAVMFRWREQTKAAADVADRVDQLKQQQQSVEGALEAMENANGVTRIKNRLLLPEAMLFELGQAEITTEGKLYVQQQLAPMLLDTLNKHERARIVVAGHTDSLPIRTRRFPSNWELSTARATTMLRTILDSGLEFPTARLSAGGYADTQPAYKDKEDQRNRRVEIRVEVGTEDLLGSGPAVQPNVSDSNPTRVLGRPY